MSVTKVWVSLSSKAVTSMVGERVTHFKLLAKAWEIRMG